MRGWNPRVLIAAGALALLAACERAETTRGVTVLGPGAAPLRAEFNAEVGKVRAILLGSPT